MHGQDAALTKRSAEARKYRRSERSEVGGRVDAPVPPRPEPASGPVVPNDDVAFDSFEERICGVEMATTS